MSLFQRLAAAAALTALLATTSQADITTLRVASGLSRPVYLTHAPGDLDRVFVVEKAGVIKIMSLTTGGIATFLDINSLVGGGTSSSDERGLLGLAFHPDYLTNGLFYVYYTDTTGNDSVIAEFEAIGDPTTSLAADAGSQTILLEIDQPQTNHNGGWIGFGPNDGYLYIATGDGGNFCDTGSGHTAGIGNAQDIDSNLLGKILRIDVGSGGSFTNPVDNPFVGVAGDDEIWAYGLRNPYRCSFDRATGDFFIGDVGQDLREEVDYQSSASAGGENYGWRCMEGTACATTSPSSCPATTGCNCPAATPGLIDPVWDYSHQSPPSPAGFVCSVIAGYVYRGDCIPEIQGQFFVSDYCGSPATWSFEVVGGVMTNFLERPEVSPSIGGFALNDIVSYGEDCRGELYIVDQGSGASNGAIYKIVPVATVTARNQAPNPASYSASVATIGGTLDATVDNNLASQLFSVLFAFDAPTSVVLGAGQVLLAIDVGSGELLTGGGLSPSSMAGGLDFYSLAVPNSLDLCGFELYSQAIQFGNPPFVLSNAQDLTLGY